MYPLPVRSSARRSSRRPRSVVQVRQDVAAVEVDDAVLVGLPGVHEGGAARVDDLLQGADVGGGFGAAGPLGVDLRQRPALLGETLDGDRVGLVEQVAEGVD